MEDGRESLRKIESRHDVSTPKEVRREAEAGQFPLVDEEPEDEEAAPNPSFRGQLFDASEVRDYILAGRAIITLVSQKTGTRYTYKITRKKDEQLPAAEQYRLAAVARRNFREKKPEPPKVRYFVSLLSGPDNTSSYVYLGMIYENAFRLTAKSKMRLASPPVTAFAWMWDKIVRRDWPKDAEIWHEGRCGRCGRKLTVPTSIESGYGPECLARIEGGE